MSDPVSVSDEGEENGGEADDRRPRDGGSGRSLSGHGDLGEGGRNGRAVEQADERVRLDSSWMAYVVGKVSLVVDDRPDLHHSNCPELALLVQLR